MLNILCCLGVALAAGQAVAAASDPASYVPRMAMPEKVFQTLSGAIASYRVDRLPAIKLAAIKEKNLAALKLMQKLPWPDFGKLKLLRLTDAGKPEHWVTAWCVPGNWHGQIVLKPNFDVEFVEEANIAEVAADSYDDVLAGLLRGDSGDADEEEKPAARPAKPSPKRPRRGREEGDLREYLDVRCTESRNPLHHAYTAAWFGKKQAAETLLHAALGESENYIRATYHEWSLRSMARGFRLLAAGDPRAEALACWQETRRLYGDTINAVPWGWQPNDTGKPRPYDERVYWYRGRNRGLIGKADRGGAAPCSDGSRRAGAFARGPTDRLLPRSAFRDSRWRSFGQRWRALGQHSGGAGGSRPAGGAGADRTH